MRTEVESVPSWAVYPRISRPYQIILGGEVLATFSSLARAMAGGRRYATKAARPVRVVDPRTCGSWVDIIVYPDGHTQP